MAKCSWDLLDRPTNIVWRKANGDTQRSFNYAYDMAGCITNIAMEGAGMDGRSTAYGYDKLDRLTAETTPGRTNTWSYDLADNRTNATHNGAATAYTLGIGDRLASTSDGATYLYNPAGCVTNISTASSSVSLFWNSQYQLTSVQTNGVLSESYQYDALGRRISTTLGGITNYYVYDDNWQVLADLDANGQPLRSYTWAPGIDHLLAMTVYTETATNTYYALTDHLGTVHALVDASGAIAESYEFDAWGNVLAVYDASGTPISNRQSAIGNRYLFQGREYSYATGLYHFRHRWYDPATGRWLSNDPIGISGGMNQYVFCSNTPVQIVDAFGLSHTKVVESGAYRFVQYAGDIKHGGKHIHVYARNGGRLLGRVTLKGTVINGNIPKSALKKIAGGIFSVIMFALAPTSLADGDADPYYWERCFARSAAWRQRAYDAWVVTHGNADVTYYAWGYEFDAQIKEQRNWIENWLRNNPMPDDFDPFHGQ